MSVGTLIARTGAIGLLALDPAGALVALAAIALGVRRRGLTVLVVAYLVAQVALGLAATCLVGVAAGTGTARTVADYWSRHRLLGWGEVVVGSVCVFAALALWWRARRTGADAETTDPDDPTGSGPAARLGGRLRSTPALAAAGGLVALSLLVDPAFSLMAVATQEFPAWSLVPVWTAWSSLSQVFLLALWLAALVDRGDHLLDRVTAVTRSALRHTGLVLRFVLVVAGITLLRAGLVRLGVVAN